MNVIGYYSITSASVQINRSHHPSIRDTKSLVSSSDNHYCFRVLLQAQTRFIVLYCFIRIPNYCNKAKNNSTV